jgi:hypothetical protein
MISSEWTANAAIQLLFGHFYSKQRLESALNCYTRPRKLTNYSNSGSESARDFIGSIRANNLDVLLHNFLLTFTKLPFIKKASLHVYTPSANAKIKLTKKGKLPQ